MFKQCLRHHHFKNEDKLACKTCHVEAAVTKRLRACVCVLGCSLPPVVTPWCSFCDATKQNKVFVLSLISIWDIFFSLNMWFGHKIFWLSIERAFHASVCRKQVMLPWYLPVYFFFSHIILLLS